MQKAKHNCFLFTDALGAGGAQRQLVGLARLLKLNGQEVKIVTYHEGSFYGDILRESGIEHEVVSKTSNKFKRILIVAKYFKRKNTDIVIAYQASPSIIACISKLLGGKYKLIVSERNTNQRYTKADRLRFLLYRWADYIVPNSYSQADFVSRHAPWLKDKLKVIVNFVDTNFFVPGEQKMKKDVLIILSIGRMTPQKNILTYIEAINILVNQGIRLRVDWYGYADQGGVYYQKCLEKISEYKLTKFFFFHEPSKEVVNLYQQADAFCLPSIYEGTPNVLCEAMSCGLPVICSDVCDNSRYVKNNGLLCNPQSVQSIVDAITQFVGMNEEQIKEMSLRSRELAIANFSSESFIKQYLYLLYE